VKKCHKFLIGRSFKIITDKSAISHIFHPNKSLPLCTANRLLHYALIRAAYDYTIEHRSADRMCVADALSRLPASTTINDVTILPDLEGGPLTPLEIANAAVKDPVLSKVLEFTTCGWPPEKSPLITPALRPYFTHRLEFTILDKFLLRGNRVVIPSPSQPMS